MALLTLVTLSCGQVYRPVVIPCSLGAGLPGCPLELPPTPAGFHTVFALSANLPDFPGGAMQIDVSGDTIVAETPSSDKSAPNLGNEPTHAAILPNLSRVFVSSAGSIAGGVDVVSSFTPAFQSTVATGLGAVNTVSLPSLQGQASAITALSQTTGGVVTVTLASPLLSGPSRTDLVLTGTPVVISGETTAGFFGYNGTFTITGINPTTLTYTAKTTTQLPQCAPNSTTFPPCPSTGTASIPGEPVYLASTESAAMYVANFNSNSVAKINTATNIVANAATVYQPSAAASPAANPVAMAETPNSLKLYIANQGNNTVSSLNTLDLSPNIVTGFTGINPIWVVARGDSQKVYVLTQGDGQLVTVDVTTDTVTSSLPVGVGANFIFFDPILNRLYVVNPLTNLVYIFSDTGGPNDTPLPLTPGGLTIPGLSATTTPACGGCSAAIPVSVTALPDGSRFYVATYQVSSPCSDGLAGATSACIVPGVVVFDANSLTVKTTLTLLTNPPFSSQSGQYQYAVPPAAGCGAIPTVPPSPPALYAPGNTRFRVFTTAAADSSRVYVGMCDAGAIAVINTTNNNANSAGGSGNPSDTLVTDLPAAFSAGAIQSNGEPPNQNPIFLLTGQ
jgi:hypothetical protein